MCRCDSLNFDPAIRTITRSLLFPRWYSAAVFRDDHEPHGSTWVVEFSRSLNTLAADETTSFFVLRQLIPVTKTSFNRDFCFLPDLKHINGVISCISAFCGLYFPECRAARHVANVALRPQDGEIDMCIYRVGFENSDVKYN